MEKTLVVMIGIQGSGKSTFYHTYLEDLVHVNLDTLKTRHREDTLVNDCIAEGKSFAVDNTNPTRTDRQRYILPARSAGYKIIGYFMESKLRVCIERNDRRTGKAKIPSMAIAATANKLEMPSYSEGFDELYFVKNDGETMTIERWKEP